MLARDKHSSLFCRSVGDEEIKFFFSLTSTPGFREPARFRWTGFYEFFRRYRRQTRETIPFESFFAKMATKAGYLVSFNLARKTDSRGSMAKYASPP